MAPRVLISDALSPAAVAIFKNRGLDVEFQPNLGKDREKLAAAIDGFDGLAIRSATKVTAKLLEHAKSLKVIGRAGIDAVQKDRPTGIGSTKKDPADHIAGGVEGDRGHGVVAPLSAECSALADGPDAHIIIHAGIYDVGL